MSAGSKHNLKVIHTKTSVFRALPSVAELISINTASSRKKRKLAPFSKTPSPDTQLYDTQSLNAHAQGRESPSSSPRPHSFDTTSPDSQVPSPTSSNTTRNPSPPRYIPPHLHEEVLPPRESVEGSSPSGAFEQITIDSGSSADMSGSENDGSNHTEQQQVVSPSKRVLGARSASPAKRSAADMEGAGGDKSSTKPGSFTNERDEGPTHFDEAMGNMTAVNDGEETQETAANSLETSAQGSMTTNTSATSFQSDAPPPYSASDGHEQSHGDNPSIDNQVSKVYELAMEPLDEGQRGYVVSSKWLRHVISRSTDKLHSSEYTKESREGEIGEVDNSDIVPEGAFTEPILKDTEGQPYIPLKPGLLIEDDYQVLPYKAWGLVVSWYGNVLGQKPIVRYAHDSAPADATQTNVIYEVYPPVITVRKVPQPNQQSEHTSTLRKSAVDELRLRVERKSRGQLTPEDAIQFVSSRTERFNQFLRRSKEAAGIPITTKVMIWKLLDSSKIAIDKPNNREAGVLSPPDSRSGSPKAAKAPESKLVLDNATFAEMEIGKDLEHIDAKDETDNSSYNGKSTMEIFQLFQDTTIVLEEMIQGPAGGEFTSDQKKRVGRFNLNKKGAGSKPASTTASGRTSPAPGSDMMTRGRQRRDGRTRGTVGLTNLGNTCYMNSALQCIRSIEELAVYFLSEKYKKEINHSNPLGHGGAMAKQYATLLQAIYADTASGAFTPSTFKKTLGSLQPLFSGYGQQDSQEFLSFLVDALHEDLNRILKKPYNENPDSDDSTVHDPQAIIKLGETYRSNHRARNDSIAMDLFSGFYKNTMECPVCDKISITFDPYSLLTVQLPIENTFQHTITFVPLRGKPVNHAVDIDKNSTIKTLKENIASKHRGTTADRLWMAEVYSHKIYKVFENATTISEASIQANDYLFVFELEARPSNLAAPSEKKSYQTYSYLSNRNDEKVPAMDDPKADQFAVPIFSRQKNRPGSGWEIIMHPLYIILTREEAQNFDTILKKVLIAVSRMTSVPILAEFNEDDDDESTANGHIEKDESVVEDNAQVSDRSVSSEDGYVEVSSGQTYSSRSTTNGQSFTEGNWEEAQRSQEQDQDDRPIPKRFMSPEYFISPALRNQLFTLNYAQSESGMHCTGMSSINDRSIRNMFDRVKLPTRRSSVQSSSSVEGSTTSSASSAQANGESEVSDIDDMDKPDISLGNESALSMPPMGGDASDEENLPENPLIPNSSRAGRRKQKRQGKNRGQKMRTYGKNSKRNHHQNRPDSAGSLRSNQSHRSFGGKPLGQDDNPYFIKLGEGIVIDWYPEALDSLFGGDPNDDEMRGHYVSSPDGRGLLLIQDAEVEAKKSRREARKKHGITLDDCFVETGKREVLSEDNAWYCNRCKELRRATKTLEIWTIPDILVVHLKRFGGNRSFRDKIDVLVDYPIESLDMTDRVGLKEDGKESVYDLFAVDNHYGGLGGGHYTAMAKNFNDGQWYDYNGK